jgi:hypothetical protein
MKFTIFLSALLLASLARLAAVAAGKNPMPKADVVEVPAIGQGLCVANVFQSNMVLQRHLQRRACCVGKGVPFLARFRQAVDLVALAGRHDHQGRHHCRSRSDEADRIVRTPHFGNAMVGSMFYRAGDRSLATLNPTRRSQKG